MLNAYQMLTGGLVLLASGVVRETPDFRWSVALVAILAGFVVMASIVQFGAWFMGCTIRTRRA